MDHPKVSILATCYKHAAFLPAFLASVREQTFEDYELLVGDDASPDGSAAILQAAAQQDPRIRVIAHEKNQGLSRNFNSLLREARGDYWAVMSCDDLMLPRKLEQQVAAMEQDPAAGACLHWVEIFDSVSGATVGRTDGATILRDPRDWTFQLPLLRPSKTPGYPATSVMYRREYAEGLSYDDRIPYKNEVLFTIDLHERMPERHWICVPEVLGRYRRHPENMSGATATYEKLHLETAILAAIGTVKHPRLWKEFKLIHADFLMRSLLYGWVPENLRRECEALLRDQVGLAGYAGYKLMRKLQLRGSRIIGPVLGRLV